MPSPPSISTSTRPRLRRSARALTGAVAGALLLGAPARAAAQGVRPPVMLDVRIDGPLYRSQLADEQCRTRCEALRLALVDSVRLAFERSFGYLDWRSAPQPAGDTLVVSWVNARAGAGELELRMLGRDGRARTRVTRIPFESFVAIADRPAGDWQRPEVLRASWLRELRAILARPSEAKRVTTQVLSYVALAPRVTLGDAPEVTVGVGAGALRADPVRSPVFLVRMHVVDPANVAPSAARQDTTEMSLVGCSRTVDQRAYRCRVDFLAFPERTPPDTLRTTAALASLARRARQQPVTLHLWTFFPMDPADDAPIRRPED